MLKIFDSPLLWPIAFLFRFAFWYSAYSLSALLIRLVINLRYQYFNYDLKFKQNQFKNQVILITGATSGIGLALAHHLHRLGYVVIACYYSQDEPGYEELRMLVDRMHLVELNVKQQDSIEKCYAHVKSILLESTDDLKLHALVNVAGVGYFHKFQWTPREAIRNMVETNLLGPILMTRQFVHLLAQSTSSRIVNVSSPLSFLPIEFNSIYGATKAGLTQFTNSLELDLLKYNIKTVSIHPGNLIMNTSIITSCLNSKLEKILPELNNDERNLYETELNKHLTKMTRFERGFKREIKTHLSIRATFSMNLKRMMVVMSGAVPEKRLNHSYSFMRQFENAIQLENPPKEMAAGNNFFNIVVNSIFEWTGRAMCRDMCIWLGRQIG